MCSKEDRLRSASQGWSWTNSEAVLVCTAWLEWQGSSSPPLSLALPHPPTIAKPVRYILTAVAANHYSLVGKQIASRYEQHTSNSGTGKLDNVNGYYEYYWQSTSDGSGSPSRLSWWLLAFLVLDRDRFGWLYALLGRTTAGRLQHCVSALLRQELTFHVPKIRKSYFL